MSKKVVALVVVVAVIGGLTGFIIGMSTPSVTSFDLYDKYHHGTETPPGWGAGEWYKYKTETPIKAYDYLYWLAYGTEFNYEKTLQQMQETSQQIREMTRKRKGGE